MSEAVIARVSLNDVHPPVSAFAPLRDRIVALAEAPGEPIVDAYRTGFADGQNDALAQWHDERTALHALIAAAEALRPAPSDELAALIATTIEQLVTALVGAVPVTREALSARIAAAMACIDATDAARTLWLHPEDVALLGNLDLPLDVRSDAALERGAIRIACSHGWIEHGLALQLESLRAALGVESGL